MTRSCCIDSIFGHVDHLAEVPIRASCDFAIKGELGFQL